MTNIENLTKEIETLKSKKSELIGQLEQAKADDLSERELSGQAMLEGATVEKAASGLVKSQDKITVLMNACSQIATNIKTAEARLSVAVFEADKAAMTDLGTAASIEADKVADQLMAAIKGLVKIDALFMQSLGLESRNFGKLTRAGAFQMRPSRIINRALGVLGQVSFCTANKKALNGLNQLETETRLVRE